jgi:capsular exopolysaccharide synthesis family protein
MSRNYELMQGMVRDQTFLPSGIVEPAFPIPGESRNREDSRQLAGDLTLGLVQQVFLQSGQESPRLVVFAAVDHGNGCSQIAASVAASLAGTGLGSVCLVEANFRSPALPTMLGTTNYHGLADALLEQGGIRSFIKPVCNDRLWLLSSGPVAADSASLLSSESMRVRAEELRAEFDFVIVDAPPMTRYADAIAVGKLSDGAVLVLEAGSTRREAARKAVQTLRYSRIPVLGAVLNKRTFPIPERIYNRI